MQQNNSKNLAAESLKLIPGNGASNRSLSANNNWREDFELLSTNLAADEEAIAGSDEIDGKFTIQKTVDNNGKDYSAKSMRLPRSIFNSSANKNNGRKAKRKATEATFQQASYLDLLRYADFADCVLLCVGIVGSISIGSANPVGSILFAGISDVLIKGNILYENGTLDMDQFGNEITFYVKEYLIFSCTLLIVVTTTLRYADSFDWFLLCVGVLGSVLLGGSVPSNTVIFSEISDVLMKGHVLYENGTLDMHQFSHDMLHSIKQYVAIGCTILVIMTITMGCMFTVCERQVHKIQIKFFEAILRQNMAWFDSNEVGALTQKMTNGTDQIKIGMSDKLVLLIQTFSGVFFGIAAAFYMSWQMAIVMYLVAPFLLLTMYFSARTTSASVRGEMAAYASAGAVAEEVLSGIRTVASFNAQLFEVNRYEKQLKVGERMGIRKAYSIAVFTGIYLFILFCAKGFTFWYGTTLVFRGIITPGTVFGVFWCVAIGAIQLGESIPQLKVIVAAKLAAGEIFSIIDRVAEPDCSDGAGLRPDKVSGRMEFYNIHFAYPSRPTVKILNGISFTVDAGESVALVGHSGCGKSTIISLLMRYYDFYQGSITVDGTPIQDLNIEWLRNTVGIVSQEPILFATTVEENMKMGKEDASMDEIIKACKMANADKFIGELSNGYKTLIGEGGVKLSGGQKQRLAIARALVRNPKILLLDEATSALDTESEQIVQKALDQASKGRTTVTIAHRLSTIRNADKIIVFDGGEIVEVGTHDELLQLESGLYRKLISAQQITQSQPEDDFDDIENLESGEKQERVNHSSATTADDEIAVLTRGAHESARAKVHTLSISLNSLNSLNSLTTTDVKSAEIMKELKQEKAKPATIMEILRFARPERKLFLWGFFFAAAMSATWPIFSIVYGQFFLALSQINDPNGAENALRSANVSAIAFALLGVMAGLSTFGSGTLLGMVGEKMTKRLRLLVFKNLLRQDGAFFDEKNHSTGRLTARLSTDAPNVQAAIDQRLSVAMQGGFSLILGVGVAFYFGWNVAPFGLMTALVLVLIQLRVIAYLQKRGIRDAKLAEESSKIASESIQYVKTVQALTRQNYLYHTFCIASAKPLRLAIIRGWWQALGYGLTYSFLGFNFSTMYGIGLLLIRGHFTSPFIVFQVIEALNKSAITILRTSSYFPELFRAKVSAGLMFSMVSQNPKIDGLSEKGMKTAIEGNVAAKSIHFAYPNARQHLVLKGFSMSASFGKTIALVGTSGCGKSTIIQLLERFYDVLSGSLMVDEIDVRERNICHLRGSMSLVGQEPTLFNISVRENIAYGMSADEITKERVEAAAQLANIHTFIESLPEKYGTSVGARGGQLSGGQKQRIAIARAIIRNPKILLLDEATSALDTESEKVVQEALDRAREGRTCVVIAHRLSTIQHADLIIVVRDGRVFESGNHQQLLARKGLYHRLVERQSN